MEGQAHDLNLLKGRCVSASSREQTTTRERAHRGGGARLPSIPVVDRIRESFGFGSPVNLAHWQIRLCFCFMNECKPIMGRNL